MHLMAVVKKTILNIFQHLRPLRYKQTNTEKSHKTKLQDLSVSDTIGGTMIENGG